jgi:hypothetical protein
VTHMISSWMFIGATLRRPPERRAGGEEGEISLDATSTSVLNAVR